MQEKAELTRVLVQKKELLKKMLLLTTDIRADLEQDRIEAFADAIGLRQQIIVQVDSLTKEEQAFSAEEDIEIMMLKKEIRGIVAQTLQQDEENTALAQQKLEKYRDQIKKLNQSKKSVGGYTRPVGNEAAYFVDSNK